MTSLSSYFVAVDVGTSRTAAATARLTPNGIMIAPFGLGRQTDSAPSAIYAGDGELLFGESAERRGIAQPERLIREFKRRVGDDVPIIAGDQRFAPEDLYARTVAWVVEAVAEREGARPAGISVTIPVAWGGYRSGLVSAALAREISGEIRLITEPEAAAGHYESTSPLDAGRALAVYDLGGGTFDAVILRAQEDGVHILGEPLGLADFGGADFDDIVVRHTISAAGLSVAELNADPANRVALATLRRECIEAKEALSFDAEAVVPVLVGGSHSTVRLTRSEFEEMIEPGVERTIDVLADALDTAQVNVSDLDAILLTGGSSRIPRIAELLSERFDRPIAIDADPKAIVALGAARALAAAHAEAVKAELALLPAPAADAMAVPLDPPASAQAFPVGTAAERAQRRWFQRVPATAAMAAGALVLAGGIVLASATGLGSSPVSNAQPESEPQSLASWLGVTLFDASSATADEPVATPPAAAPAPPEAIQRADYQPDTSPRATNPRSQSMQKAVEAPRPTAPSGSTATGGGTGGSGGGTTPSTNTTDQTPTDTTTPSPTPSDTTPAETPSPTPSDTPSETPTPTPSETTTEPTPTETTDPTPSESPSESPAPESTPTETQTPPASEPDPSTTP